MQICKLHESMCWSQSYALMEQEKVIKDFPLKMYFYIGNCIIIYSFLWFEV